MYTLYWSADSGAFGVQALLEELGLPYRREIVDTSRGEHRTPEYLALNPMAQVPALRLPDGTVITESAAMMLHLCDARPDAVLLPAPGTTGRAVAYRWLFWLASGLYESDLRYYYPDRYTSEPAGAPGVQAAALERMDRLLAIAADLLGVGPLRAGPALLRGRPLSVHAGAVAPGQDRDPCAPPRPRRADAAGAAAPGGRADLGAALPPGRRERVVDLDRLERALIQAARERRAVTYGQLLGLFERRVTPILVAALCRDLGKLEQRRADAGWPELACLVVRRSDGLPGEGYFDSLRREGSYAGPSIGPPAEAFLRGRQERAFRWAASLAAAPASAPGPS